MKKTAHLSVVHADDTLVVVNKPAGLVCHPVGQHQGDTLLARVRHYFGADVRIVHRLDQFTSGVIVVARNPEIASYLYHQFFDRLVVKFYLALVYGSPDQDCGDIHLPIASAPGLIKIKMRVDANGLPAHTCYQVLQRSRSHSLLLVRTFSGRRHQIRLHLASIGTPVVSDDLYRHAGLPFLWRYYYLSRPYPWQSEINGYGLHAYSLQFQHPQHRTQIKFIAPPPTSWANLLRNSQFSKKDTP